MKKMVDLIGQELAEAFEKAGYDPSYAKVTHLRPPGSVRVSVQRGHGGGQSLP